MDKFFTVLVLLGLIVGSIGLIGLIAALLAKKTPAKKMLFTRLMLGGFSLMMFSLIGFGMFYRPPADGGSFAPPPAASAVRQPENAASAAAPASAAASDPAASAADWLHTR